MKSKKEKMQKINCFLNNYEEVSELESCYTISMKRREVQKELSTKKKARKRKMANKLPVGIQVYGLRDLLENTPENFKDVMQKIKDMGYDGVELAGLYGLEPENVKAILDEVGLVPISAHVAFAEMMENLDQILKDYSTIGVKYLVMPYMAEEYRPVNPEGFESFLPLLNEVGKKIHDAGMTFLFKRDDIDEVEVCVHNNLHTSVATAVMAAGFDCYSEKPMSASYADAKILYDAQKKYGKKLAIQISSIYNPQTRIAKKMIEEGKLGKVYHARSVGHRRQGRPGYDMPFFSKDFINPKVGVHGPLFDLGIYHLAQMLYVLGMPELESVYGVQSCDYWTDERIDKITNRIAPVEDLGVGIARFKGGLSMDIYEDWAIHMDEIGTSFVAGSEGGLKFIDVDTTGGPLAVPEGGQIMGGGMLQKPRLTWFGVDKDGVLFENKLDCAIGDITGQQELMLHPEMEMYNDNQLQWYSYLRGDLDDTTRIDSPYIAMQTAFLSDGVVLSSELGRSVTADEIKAMSKSIALREQETPFGTIKYDFDEYKPE